MGLTVPNWAKIQNLHFQYLGSKTTCKRWISDLIRKLRDMPWEVWNHCNQNLNSTNGPMKFEILRLIKKESPIISKKIVQAFLCDVTLYFILSTTLYSPSLSTNASHT